MPESRLFIKAKRAGQARLEPNLPVENIPNKDFLEDLLVETKATDTWIAYFTSANAAVHKRRRDDDGSPWEDDMGSPALADLERTSRNFNTPKKLHLGILMTAGFEEPEVPESAREGDQCNEQMEIGFESQGSSQHAGFIHDLGGIGSDTTELFTRPLTRRRIRSRSLLWHREVYGGGSEIGIVHIHQLWVIPISL